MRLKNGGSSIASSDANQTKGFKCTTYATLWIRRAIARALADKARTIRLPVHVVEKLNEIRQAERRLATELGRQPTMEEIAHATGINPGELESIRQATREPISLEKPVGEEDETELGHMIADPHAASPYEQTIKTLTHEALYEALENLSDRQRRVLELRYGLAVGRPHTLDEISRTIGVTRERVRQIDTQAQLTLRDLLHHTLAPTNAGTATAAIT